MPDTSKIDQVQTLAAQIQAMQGQLSAMSSLLNQILNQEEESKPEDQEQEQEETPQPEQEQEEDQQEQDNLGETPEGTNKPEEADDQDEAEEDSQDDGDDQEQEQEGDDADEGQPEDQGQPQDKLGNADGGTHPDTDQDGDEDAEDGDGDADGQGQPTDEEADDADTDEGTEAEGIGTASEGDESGEGDGQTDADGDGGNMPSIYAGEGKNTEEYTEDELKNTVAQTIVYPPVHSTPPGALAEYWRNCLHYQADAGLTVVRPMPELSQVVNTDAYRLTVKHGSILADQIAGQLSVPPRSADGYEPGYRSGELDEEELWQIGAGIDDPTPFAKLYTMVNPDLAIGLLVDCSGSTGYDMVASDGTRPIIQRARELAYGLHTALTAHGLPVAVWGFSESGSYTDDNTLATDEEMQIAKDRLQYYKTPCEYTQPVWDKYGPSMIAIWRRNNEDSLKARPEPHYKDYERKRKNLYGDCHPHIYRATSGEDNHKSVNPMALIAGGGNPDGASILWAARDLKEQFPDAQAHIIIQISDGQPARSGLRDNGLNQSWGEIAIAVQEALSIGVKCLHIGVGDAFQSPTPGKEKDETTNARAVFNGQHVSVRTVADGAPPIIAMLQRTLDDL